MTLLSANEVFRVRVAFRKASYVSMVKNIKMAYHNYIGFHAAHEQYLESNKEKWAEERRDKRAKSAAQRKAKKAAALAEADEKQEPIPVEADR